MDSDFMNNLSNMFNNGNIPDEVKSMLNNFKTNSGNVNNTDNSNNSNNENNSFQDSNNESNSNGINPEMLKNIMNMFNNSNNVNNSSDSSAFNTSNTSNNTSNIDINTLLKMKSIMDKINTNKNDPRSNLLLSLKPYLKESRKSKVEQYVQLFNMTKVIDAFNQNGGENAK